MAAKAASRSAEVRQRLGRAPRIAILDIDVHHGDGTQALLDQWNEEAVELGEPPVLFISTHRYDSGTFYPGTGAPERVGALGMMLNVAFDTARTKEVHRIITDDTLVLTARRLVVPVLEAFAPDIVMVSCGFDAADGDPLGGMGVVNGFAGFTGAVSAGLLPNVPMICVLEGGYDVEAVAQGTRSVVRTLMDPSFKVTPSAPPGAWLKACSSLHSAEGHVEMCLCLAQLRERHSDWVMSTLRRTAQASVSTAEAVPFPREAHRVREALQGILGGLDVLPAECDAT